LLIKGLVGLRLWMVVARGKRQLHLMALLNFDVARDCWCGLAILLIGEIGLLWVREPAALLLDRNL
jgi:hypothetical protein